MTTRPRIFISAVSEELRSARQLVANTLQFLGYEPVWQDIFGKEVGDLRAMLRKKIDDCEGVIQLIGYRYGAEPPVKDEQFGRTSYTQYETRYARLQGKKVWYMIDITPLPHGTESGELEELRQLQEQYRESIKAGTHIYYEVNLKNDDAVKIAVHEIKDELAELRRGVKRLVTIWTALLVLILALVGGVLYVVLRPPQNPVTEELANAAFIAKDYPTAFAAYIQLSDSDPANIKYHRSIEECARLGRLEKPFLERYLGLLRQEPTNAIVHNFVGNAYLMLDPQDKDGIARGHYESAVSFDSKLYSPLANLGILAFRAGKSDEAESLFKRYLAGEPRDAQGWVNLGVLYLAKLQTGTGETQAVANAENAIRKALQIEPSSASAYKSLGRLLTATGRNQEALNAYQRSLALKFEQPEVRQQVELLAWDSADASFLSIQADDFKTRDGAGILTNLPAAIIAMKLLDQGKFQRAETVCSEWTKLDPQNPLAWRLLGRACEKQGRFDDARRAFAQIEALSKLDRE